MQQLSVAPMQYFGFNTIFLQNIQLPDNNTKVKFWQQCNNLATVHYFGTNIIASNNAKIGQQDYTLATVQKFCLVALQ